MIKVRFRLVVVVSYRLLLTVGHCSEEVVKTSLTVVCKQISNHWIRKKTCKPIPIAITQSTVKPVYNGHPWDPKKVVIAHRW